MKYNEEDEEVKEEAEEQTEESETIKEIEPEDLEQEVEEQEQEQDFEQFSDFVSTGERVAPVLQASDSLQEIPDINENIENIANTAPGRAEQQIDYAINAPDYNPDNYLVRQEENERATDMQRDITRAGLMHREQDITSRAQEINLRTWQHADAEMAAAGDTEHSEDYVAKMRRRKHEDKLPFE